MSTSTAISGTIVGMHLRVRHAIAAVTAAALPLTAVACAQPAAPRQESAMSPLAVAIPVAADPRVGALYPGDGPVHICSASVLDTDGGDLVLTAAHCLAGDPDATFVPGLAGGVDQVRSVVEAAYLDPRWLADQDPRADFAILRMDTDLRGAGGGFAVGAAPPPGTPVTVRGYAGGADAVALGCRAPTALVVGYPELPCAGLVSGLSGAPWTVGTTVVGIVGGLDGGGCEDDLSYSPPFDGAILRLLERARAGGPGDIAPESEDDGCSAGLTPGTG